MSRTWSTQQVAIFDWAKNPTTPIHSATCPCEKCQRNGLVRARAGTGKTTTILEMVNHAPESRILLSAFNKKIADELQSRLSNPHAEAKTLHGLGFGCIRRNWERVTVDNGRSKRLASTACGQGAPDAMVALVAKLAGLGKEMAPFAKDSATLAQIAYKMDVTPDPEWEEDGWDVERIAGYALKAMGLALNRDGAIDFSDMLYLPLALKWTRPSYDLVCIDECQDMNEAQIELAIRSCSKGGRIIVVGDDRQAIYGFRGADSGSLDRLKTTLNAKEFPLTITYRCAQTIVDQAREIVPDYQAAPNAPQGISRSIASAKLPQEVKVGDFVISRKNAPLVRTCLSILRTGTRAKVEGRDLGKNLLALVRKLKAKSIPDLSRKLETWADREIKRLASLKPEIAERKASEIDDTAETLRVLSDGLSGLGELEKRIEALFADDVAAGRDSSVVCSTIHRVKGLEANRAFILKGTLATGKRAGNQEEQNCLYVAITRAKNELVWVEGE